MFFFEKKNQKTYVTLSHPVATARCESAKVFLLLFLQKKKTLP